MALSMAVVNALPSQHTGAQHDAQAQLLVRGPQGLPSHSQQLADQLPRQTARQAGLAHAGHALGVAEQLGTLHTWVV